MAYNELSKMASEILWESKERKYRGSQHKDGIREDWWPVHHQNNRAAQSDRWLETVGVFALCRFLEIRALESLAQNTSREKETPW